jgi:isoleucyl-tRNA synthetase
MSWSRKLLAQWERRALFARLQQARAGGTPWVFFEGPPTANGRPGIHHVFARTVKDLFCRHRAMQGYSCPRKAGWDTHGLPVEIEVEKALGISGKQDIERIGVAEFNRRCRESVWTYRGDWEKLSARMATGSTTMRSVRHVQQRLRGERVVGAEDAAHQGYCCTAGTRSCRTARAAARRCRATRSRRDTRTSRIRRVYVALDLVRPAKPIVRRRIVVWTTTPWTLVSNTALAVHPTLSYVGAAQEERSDWTMHAGRSARARGARRGLAPDRWDVVARCRAGPRGDALSRPLDWVEYPGSRARTR